MTRKAEQFAKENGIKLTILGSEYRKYFSDDKKERYVFKLRLSRNRKSYTFTFGQSISAGAEEPTLYDVLSSMTLSDPYSFETFCSEFGYDQYDNGARKTYKAVVKEYKAMIHLFGDIMEEVADICNYELGHWQR